MNLNEVMLMTLLASIGSIQKSHPMEQWSNINGVAWLPLAPFRNYSQWSNGAMSMELFSIHLNG